MAYEPFATLGKLIAFNVFFGQIANKHIDVGIIKLGGHQQLGAFQKSPVHRVSVDQGAAGASKIPMPWCRHAAHPAALMPRFLAACPQEQNGLLQPGPVQTADAAGSLQAPLTTALIRGIRNGVSEPLAIVLMTFPTVAADDLALLEFVVRRRQAHKAPYFITWTL